MALVSHKRRSTAIAFAERFVQLIQGLNSAHLASAITRAREKPKRYETLLEICHQDLPRRPASS